MGKALRMRLVALTAAILLLMTSLPAGLWQPVSAQTVQGPRRGGTLIHQMPWEPISINPGLVTAMGPQACAAPAFNSLLETRTMELAATPGLAERWEISSDKKTYTFYLVKNASWHDGKKFTSADVKFTFEEILLKYHPQGKLNFGVIESIEAPDDYTIRFRLRTPWPSFLVLVSNTFHAPILPKHVFEGTDIRQNPANFAPVGTGAFKFVEYVKGDRIVYDRNPNYWRAGKPYMDRLIMKIIPKEETAVAAMLKGEVDMMGYWTSPAAFNTLKQSPDINVERAPYAAPSVGFLLFNVDNPILKNLKVRQAIAHSVERNKISEIAREGFSPPAIGPVHEFFKWAFDPEIQPTYPFDLKKAEQLLDEAGYPRKEGGIRFKLILNNLAGMVYNKDGEMIKDRLKDIGVEIDHRILSNPTADELLFLKRDFDLAVRMFTQGPDPSITLGVMYHSKQVGAGTYTNCMGYKSSEADSVLEQAQVETDAAKRRQLMRDWQQIVLRDLPCYPLTFEYYGIPSRKEWVGIPSNPWRVMTMFAENMWWTKGTLIEAPTTTTTTPTTTKPSPPPAAPDLTLMIGVAIAVVLAGAIVTYSMRRKSAKKT